nr:uncharacterized protein LOC111420487 [Onthophagus taurus]
MKVLLVSCLLMITITTGSALKCWMCMGSMESDCFRGEQVSMTIQDCDLNGAKNAPLPEKDAQVATVQKCVDFVSIISGTEVLTRGCGWIYENVDICKYMDSVTSLVNCKSCDENLCNAYPLIN